MYTLRHFQYKDITLNLDTFPLQETVTSAVGAHHDDMIIGGKTL